MAYRKRLKNYNKSYLSNPTYIKGSFLGLELIQRVMSNNKALLRAYKITQAQQLRDFKVRGLTLHNTYIFQLEKGKIESCNTTYLGFFADYWHKSLIEFVSVDYSLEANVAAFKGLKSVSGDQLAGVAVVYPSLDSVAPVVSGESLPLYYDPATDA